MGHILNFFKMLCTCISSNKIGYQKISWLRKTTLDVARNNFESCHKNYKNSLQKKLIKFRIFTYKNAKLLGIEIRLVWNCRPKVGLPPRLNESTPRRYSPVQCGGRGHIGNSRYKSRFVSIVSWSSIQKHLKMSEREDNVYKAKLAEQAERYDGKCIFHK